MLDSLESRCLDFLYEQVRANKIPQIKKGMVEDLVVFIINLEADTEAEKIGKKMLQQKESTEEDCDNDE